MVTKETAERHRALEEVNRPYQSDQIVLVHNGQAAIVDSYFGLRLYRRHARFLSIVGESSLFIRRASISTGLSMPTDQVKHGNITTFIFNMSGPQIGAAVFIGESYKLESIDGSHGRVFVTIHASKPLQVERVPRTSLEREMSERVSYQTKSLI